MVYVAVDAVGTRHAVDHETALRRMESAGVVLTTTEAAMFEWCRIAGTAGVQENQRTGEGSPRLMTKIFDRIQIDGSDGFHLDPP